jgi:hypothetical protein
LALDASKNVVSVTNTGTGNNVLATSPTLVTPALGTPSSATLTNATGLPVSTGISGLGTGIATALAVNVGTAGAPVINGGVLGTPSSGTVTNLTGTASININGTVGATTANSGAFTTLSATGVTTVQAGSAGAPAITTSGDTNTGIFFPAADQVATSVGGVEGTRLTSTGLGIGTSSPTQRLTVLNSNGTYGTAYQPALLIGNISSGGTVSANTGLGALVWSTDGPATPVASIEAIREDPGSGAASGIAFRTGSSGGGSERARIDSSGNLGLGVTPSAGWGSGYKAQQVLSSSIYASGDDLNFASNTYVDSAGTPRYITSFSYPTRYEMYNGVHKWYTSLSTQGAGNAITFTQAMTLDASGNLAVGTTSASSRLEVSSTGIASNMTHGASSVWGVKVIASGSTELQFSGNIAANSGPSIRSVTSGGAAYAPMALDGSYLAYLTGGTERARIDSSGNFMVGTTSATGKVTISGIGGSNGNSLYISGWGSGVGGAATWKAVSTLDADVMYFETSGAQVGKIAITSTATSYVTSSDYRLKNTIAPMTGALARVAALKPCTYKWNVDGSDGEGFIAHELAEVVPQCVTGEKDAVDAEGKPQYQGIDTSFLVATLTAAIQEQQALIQTLTARVAALESN